MGVIRATVLLYARSRSWFLPTASGPLHLFLVWYFSDSLAGILLSVPVGLLLALERLSPIHSVPVIAGYLLACDLFLELTLLLCKPPSMCNPWDLLAYLADDLLALLLGRRLLSHGI